MVFKHVHDDSNSCVIKNGFSSFFKLGKFCRQGDPLCPYLFILAVDCCKSNIYLFVYLLFYVAFNSQGHIATGSLQVEETSAYCTVNHRASASNYQLSNMKRPARDSNQRPQRLEARTLTTTPPSPLARAIRHSDIINGLSV